MKIHVQHLPKFASVLMLALVIFLIRGNIAMAFANRSCTAINPVCKGGPVHETITDEALSFLKAAVKEKIANQHVWVDVTYPEDSQWHFDDCEFSQSIENINTFYGQLLNHLNPDQPDLEAAQETFGKLLHPIQDFYSHSNWVETKSPELLMDNGYGLWTVPTAYALYRGVVIVQGENIPPGVTLTRTEALVTVNVITPTQTLAVGSYKGLISGSTYFADDCSDGAGTMPHDDGLNKDNASIPNFPEARSKAVQQTSHEWCRLLSLVEQRYGVSGVKYLFDNLVRDKEGARAACPKDVVLIIDSTGSMTDNDPLRRRVEAAKVFIDAAPLGDRIAVVSFNTGATTLATLQEIKTVADRTALKQAVDAVAESGNTNINAGLNSGFSELLPTGRALNIAILLTDGQHNVGFYDPNSHSQYIANDWPIYTIGLGSDTDPALLGEIATETGGNYVALTAATQLQDLYHQISQRLAGGNQIYQQSARMSQGDTLQTTVSIDEFRPSISFFTSWSEDLVSQQLASEQLISGQVGNERTIRDARKTRGSAEREKNTAYSIFANPTTEISLNLVSPSGQLLEPATTDPNVFHAKGATYELYIIRNPEAGQWTMNLLGSSIPTSGANINLNVSVTGAIDKLFLPLVTN